MLFEITPTAPYDFDLTVGSMTYFQARHAADMFEDGILRRVLPLNEQARAHIRALRRQR